MPGAPAVKRSVLFRNRVGRRMLALFLLCALVPVVIGGGLTFQISEQQLQRQSSDNLRRATKASGLWLYDRLLAVEDTLALIATNVSGAKPGSLRRLPPGLSSRLLSLSFVPDGGSVEAVMGSAIELPTFSERDKKHLGADKTLLRVIAGPGGRAQIVLIRRTVAGVIMAEPHPDFLWRLGEDSDTRICVTTGELTYLHCPYPPSDELMVLLHAAQEDALSGHVDDPMRAQEHNYYWTLFLDGRFATASWLILAQHSANSGGTSARALFLTVFPSVLLLTVLLVLLVSLVQIRRFTQPLDRLIAATRLLASGEFSARVEVKSNDEFEQLGDSFNAMTGNLNETFTALAGLSEIDQVILTAGSTERVLDAVAANLTRLTNCERGALITLPLPNERGRVRSSSRQQPFQIGQEPQALDDLSLESVLSRPQASVLDSDERLPSCLGSAQGASGRKVVWLPFEVAGEARGVLVCIFEANVPLNGMREQRVKDLGGRLSVALADARKAENLYRQANFDSLTGLANRNQMDEVLATLTGAASKSNAPVAVMFIDVDRFKTINDTLGHAQGDEFLVQVADRLRKVVPEDALVARFGGDEFVCVVPCPNTDPALRSREIARAIMLAATRPFELANREVSATLSIGISLCPIDGADGAELLKKADIALYHAKALGKDDFAFFADALTTDAARRMEIELALRDALINGDLELEYQPQVDLESGDVHGVEALLRWPNCPLGNVSPTEFIPIAEESRLIVDLGAWVLREACKQARAWQDRGIHGVTMSVNLAPRDFLHPGLPVQLAEAIRQNRLDGRLLELEITESSVMEDIGATVQVLERLRSLGVKVAVDDFGTGHSSLEYLAQLPVDTLKIDQVFIREAVVSKSARAIVETVISLAHKLDMRVVAEGVETDEHLDVLRQNGCDFVQGYVFARPMNAHDFEAWWSRRRARSPKSLKPIEENKAARFS